MSLPERARLRVLKRFCGGDSKEQKKAPASPGFFFAASGASDGNARSIAVRVNAV
jgi:hypothetical protein